MNGFLKHTFMGFVGVAIAAVVVNIIATIIDQPLDNVVGWVALSIAGAASMTKMDRY